MPPQNLGVLPLYRSVRPRFYPHRLSSVASTNAALWELIDQGAAAGTVVMADRQSAGRGQWGRQWQSAPGGLYLSLALQPDLPTHASHHLTLASAWGIATSLNNLGLPVGVKWPNDLVFSGYKLGGILSETRIEQDCIRDVVIGVGLNWSNPVPPTGITLQQLQASQQVFAIQSLEHLAAVVLYGLIQGYLHLQSRGAAKLIADYQNLLVNMGQEVIVNGMVTVVTGVNTAGNLQVKSEPGARTTGEILELQPGQISLGYEPG